jgi:cellulose synthase/poly-beta-1,6-N-acetylglucosamine synthase-like glycosyltransferase
MIFVYILSGLTLLYAMVAFLFFVGLHLLKKGNNEEQHSVSVIIAARNEEDNIARILQDLTQQTYPKEKYEVIVANDCSQDGTGAIIDDFCQKFPFIKHIFIEKIPAGFSPKKYVLDVALQHAQNDVILTTDADCRISSRWIETMVSYFEPDVGFVVGFSQFGKSYEKRTFLERLQAIDFMQLMGAAAGSANLKFPLAASGQNLGYLKKAYARVGGYKKVAHRVSGDDVLLLQLVKKFTDYKVVFAASPNSFAISEPQPTFMSLVHQRLRWASNGSYQLKLNIPFFAYLLLVYLVSLVSLVALFVALFAKVYVEIILLTIVIKFISELMIAVRAAQVFRRMDLLKYFPVWFFLQMPYIVFMGILGSLGNFSWKGREHTAKMVETTSGKFTEIIHKIEDLFWKS